jgi:small subunit ribosomal protein S11
MSGARMIQRGTGRSSSPSSLHGIVHIHNSSNNIILTLTDLNGQVKACSSAGSVGFKNARKSLPAAAEKAAEELAKKALKLGYESARCHLKGVGNNKQYAVQSLATSGLRLTHLVETTSFPHNGCRMPKRRRI